MKISLEQEVKRFYLYSQKHKKSTIKLLKFSLNISAMVLGYYLAGMGNKEFRIRALYDLLDSIREGALVYCEDIERSLKCEKSR